MDFIFSYDGLPMIKSTIEYCTLCQVGGCSRDSSQGLRHSHVSFLINEINASVLIVSKRLGHSSPEIALKHYAHLWRGIDDGVAESMAGVITISTAPSKQFAFTGNQSVKQLSPELSQNSGDTLQTQ